MSIGKLSELLSKVVAVYRDGVFSQPTFYVWKKKFGEMGDGRLKRLLAERDLELDVMKEFRQK